ncbi:MAG TPA: cupredoxin domain-containing protein [Myxococcota bacterium]|nr:cupredoxin domain-containing protein [Myxococcota bacterium]
MRHHGFLMKRVLTLRAVFVVVGLLLLTLIGAGAVVPRAECAGPPVQVRMSPVFGFLPPTLTVQRGTIVTWVNDDELPHTVTSTEGVFASQAIHSDESFFFRFDAPGTYSYFSGFQPHMTGRIVVR